MLTLSVGRCSEISSLLCSPEAGASDREVFGVELDRHIGLRCLASDRHLPCKVPLLAINIQRQLIVSWYKKVDEMSNLLHKTSIPEYG